MISKIHFQDTSAVYKRAVFNLLTSSSLLVILHFNDSIQHLGKLHSLYIPLILVGFEVIKHLLFKGLPHYQGRQLKSKWFWAVVKTLLLIVTSIVCYFILAILYGARAFTEHEETIMFAVYLTVCTTIHCIINMGAKEFNAMLMKPSQLDEIVLNSAQVVAVCSVFGCWASAVVIPLDWDRWWQKWPIPCIMGTFLGYIFGFLMTILLAYVNNDRMKLNQQKKKRCV